MTQITVSVSFGTYGDDSLIASNPAEISMIEKCSGTNCNKTVLTTISSSTPVELNNFGHIQTHRIGFRWSNLPNQLTFDLLEVDVCS